MVTFYLLTFFSLFVPRKIIKGGEMNFSNADPYLDSETPFFSLLSTYLLNSSFHEEVVYC